VRQPSGVILVGLGDIAYKYETCESSINETKSSYSKTHFIAAKKAGLKVLGGIDPVISSRKSFEQFSSLPTWKSISEVHHDLSSCLIIISAPAENHLAAISEVIKLSNPFGIICEKPFGASESESQIILEKMHKLRLPLLVNYTRQYSPGFTRLINSINLGNFQSGFLNYNYGMRRSASHFIRLVIGILGAPLFVEKGNMSPVDGNPSFSLVYSEDRRFYFLGVQNSGLQVSQGILKTNEDLISLNDGHRYEIRRLPEGKNSPYWSEDSTLIFSGNLLGGLDEIYANLEWCSTKNYESQRKLNYLDNYCNQIMDKILT
jgi:hypothetical protein